MSTEDEKHNTRAQDFIQWAEETYGLTELTGGSPPSYMVESQFLFSVPILTVIVTALILAITGGKLGPMPLSIYFLCWTYITIMGCGTGLTMSMLRGSMPGGLIMLWLILTTGLAFGIAVAVYAGQEVYLLARSGCS